MRASLEPACLWSPSWYTHFIRVLRELGRVCVGGRGENERGGVGCIDKVTALGRMEGGGEWE